MRINTLQINMGKAKTVQILVALVLIMIFSYVYMVNVVSFNTANRERVAGLISIRQSEVGELESQFLVESKKIDRSVADRLGLTKSVVDETIVVVRDNSTRLTINNE